jgi:hypothetical protein
MIFDATYIDKKTKEKLETELGGPFGFLARFKDASGIGSHRMIIDKASSGFAEILERATGTVYGSIEMRPKGILVHFNVKNTQYSWSIPFYRMVFYRTDYFSIHSEGEFISFRKDHFLDRNTTFINRLMRQRNQYLGQFEGPNG